jgi:tetratricopeptide (TPR) repeat protein
MRLPTLLTSLLIMGVASPIADAADVDLRAARAYDSGLRASLSRDHATAHAAFLEAARHDTDMADAHYRLGLSHIRQSRWHDAASALRRATEVDPDYVEAFTELGRVYVTGMARSSRAAEALGRAVELAPTSARAWAYLGQAYVRSGRTRDAIDAYEHATAQDPTDTAAKYELGAALLRSGSLAAASEHLDAVVRVDPYHAKATLALGQAYLRAGRTPEGRRLLDTFRRLAETDERIAYLDRRTRTSGRDADAWHELARIYADRKQWSAAMQAFRACAQARPDDPRGQEGVGYVLINLGVYDEAMRVYDDLVRAYPSEAQYRNSLGVIHLMTGRNDQAAEQFRVATESDPANVGPYANLAEALKRAGRTAEYRRALARYREVSGDKR